MILVTTSDAFNVSTQVLSENMNQSEAVELAKKEVLVFLGKDKDTDTTDWMTKILYITVP